MDHVAGWKSRVAVVPHEGGSAAAVVDELPLAGNDALAERAEALREVRHPNVETVWEVRREDAALVVVAEHFEGERLDVLVREGPPPIEVALRIVVDVLAALAALHARTPPVAHGAVEPSNVVVGADGITRVVRAWLFGREATVAGDLRALGALIEQLVPETSRPKWAAPLAGIVAKARSADLADGYESAADMTRDLRMMGRTKIARPGRIAAFVEALAGDAIAARRRALPAPTTPRGQTVRMPAASAAARKKTPRPTLLAPVPPPKTTGGFRVPKERPPWVALLLLLLLLGGGGAWWVRSRQHAPPPTPTVDEQPTSSSALLGDLPPPESPAVMGSAPVGGHPRAASHAPTAPTTATSSSGAASSAGRRPYDRSAIF